MRIQRLSCCLLPTAHTERPIAHYKGSANAGVLYLAAVCMNLDEATSVERTAIDRGERDWARLRHLNAMASGPEGTEKEFQYIVCHWLRFSGRSQEPVRPPTPRHAELDANRARSDPAGWRGIYGKADFREVRSQLPNRRLFTQVVPAKTGIAAWAAQSALSSAITN
jgi:hypothetical protein